MFETNSDVESQISRVSGDEEQYVGQQPHEYRNDTQQKKHQQEESDSDSFIHTITTSGAANEFVHIGNKKYRRKDLIEAFGGTLVPGSQVAPTYRFANPAPLGLSAFGLTTLILSLVNVQARSVKTPNIVVGLAIFYGGFVQLLAGMWEISLNNAFGGTALSSFGGFWLSFGAIYIKWFGIIDAYKSSEELENAVGFYLIGWCIFTLGLTLLTLKSTLAFFLLFFFLTLTFLLLAIGKFALSVGATKAGGVLGIITAFVAFYNAFAGLATRENSYITPTVLRLPEDVFHPKKRV